MDVSLEWQGDFQLDANNDLFTVDADDETRQRLERRLFTAVNGYVWHPEYGAGLPQKIGTTLSVEQITAIVQSQVTLEAAVAPNPPAQVSVGASPNNPANIIIGIVYWDAVAGVSVSFSITA